MSRVVGVFLLFLVAAVFSAQLELQTLDSEFAVTLTKETFHDFVTKNQNTLVDFYAPWCSNSKKLAPLYEEVGFIARGHFAVGKVDCVASPEICDHYQIDAYPYIFCFRKGGTEKFEYPGNNDPANILRWTEDFCNDRQLLPRSDVVELNKKNFDLVVKPDSKVLIEFVTPWCKFSQRLSPIFTKTATYLRGRANLAKVDCTQNEEICSYFKVESYPTLICFKNGLPKKYTGPRSIFAIEEYTEKECS